MHSIFSRDLHVIGSFSRDLDVYAERKHDIQNKLSIHKRILNSAFLSIVIPRELSMLPVKMRKNNLNGVSRTLEDLQLKYCIGSGKKAQKIVTNNIFSPSNSGRPADLSHLLRFSYDETCFITTLLMPGSHAVYFT